jgi:hypothetical protein
MEILDISVLLISYVQNWNSAMLVDCSLKQLSAMTIC